MKDEQRKREGTTKSEGEKDRMRKRKVPEGAEL